MHPKITSVEKRNPGYPPSTGTRHIIVLVVTHFVYWKYGVSWEEHVAKQKVRATSLQPPLLQLEPIRPHFPLFPILSMVQVGQEST